MTIILKIIVFLFGGIGATLIGVYLAHYLTRRRLSMQQITGKTTIVTEKKNEPTVYPPVSLSAPLTSKKQPTKTKIIESIIPEVLPKMNNEAIVNWSPDYRKDLSEHISTNMGFDPTLTKIAVFKDGAFSAISTSEDKFVYGDKDNNTVLYSSLNPDKWGEVTFKKTNDEISYIKIGKGNVAPAQSYNVFIKPDNDAIDKQLAVSYGANLSSLSNTLGDQFVFADKNDGVIISSKHDPDKWEEVDFKKTKDEIIYRLKKKS